MKLPLILYHDNCADGFCAAWVAHKVMPDAEFVAVQYGQEPPHANVLSGRQVFVLDFSYKRAVLSNMVQQCNRIVVLDHHRTAQAELADLRLPGVTCVFDMGKSGGRLTWEYFSPGKESPWMVDYTEDRDLWLWKLPGSKEVSAALASYPKDFAVWDSLDNNGLHSLNRLEEEGRAILRYQEQQVASQAENAAEIEMDGHKVLAVNATMLISEIAGKLAEGKPFGASYFMRNDGKRVWSLRSRDGGVDVSEIAKKHGGGGHRNAAGFEE